MLKSVSPARILVFIFLLFIITGSVLLFLPFSQNSEKPAVALIDCFFISASAVCLTGLTTVSVAESFSVFGQVVIMLLIQLGGLGYMTLATLIALIYGKLPLKEKLILTEATNQVSFRDITKFLKKSLKLILIFESFGALLIFLYFYPKFGAVKSLYYGVFHAVSAFNNAGFSVLPYGVLEYGGSYMLLSVISFLVIFGGLGYIVLIELLNLRHTRKLLPHSKMVLIVTAVFLAVPSALFLISEYNNPVTIGGMGFFEKLLNSFFTVTMARTAGFASINIGYLNSFSLFMLIFLMFVGAAPGGTGGGVKITTFAVIISTIYSTLRGRADVNFLGRKIEEGTVKKSFTMVSISILWIFIAAIILVSIEKSGFLDIIFETVSAFGTVGLSTGITAGLSGASKLMIILTMFIGRLGPLTIGTAIMLSGASEKVKFPQAKVLVG